MAYGDSERNNPLFFSVLGFFVVLPAVLFGLGLQSLGSQPKGTASDQASVATLDTGSPVSSKMIIADRCHMGTCGWNRIEQQTILADKSEGRLIKVKATYAEKQFPGDYPKANEVPVDLDWGSPTTSFVLCSKRMPMLIGQDGEAHALNIGSPPGVEEGEVAFWRGICGAKGSKGYPGEDTVTLYRAAIEGKRFRDPKSVLGALPTYPAWLVGRWGWNREAQYPDGQCDVFTGFRTDHSLDHYEMSGIWMVVGDQLWAAWNPYSDDEGSIESNAIRRKDADHIMMDDEEFFRCAT